MRDKNKAMIILITAVLLVGIAIVFVISGRDNKSQLTVDQSGTVEEVVVSDTEVPATEVQQAPDPTQTEVVEEQVLPTIRAGLGSTDPATVNLASGEIQLVEVFAFW